MPSLKTIALVVCTAFAMISGGHLAGAPAAITAPVSAGWTPRPATYEVVTERDVPITMSDGIRLYADIHRPARGGEAVAGRFPVVLTQTPYNKTSPLGSANPYLVSRGYVHVVTDVRGAGSSQGKWSSFGQREQRDGYELVRWVASSSRAWSNGKVGTYGPSYMAINQIFTAAQRPAGLKAAFAIVPSGDVYRDVVGSGGQLDVGFIPAWLTLVTAAGMVPPGRAARASSPHGPPRRRAPTRSCRSRSPGCAREVRRSGRRETPPSTRPVVRTSVWTPPSARRTRCR